MKKIIKGYIEKAQTKTFNEIKFIYILAGLLFVAALGLGVFFALGYFRGGSSDIIIHEFPTAPQEEECEYRRLLDGICVEHQKDVDPDLIAVMVENHTDARPQSGLSQARVVYEAPVEANYTRFMLIYPRGEEVLKVGPVRSARPYYLDWLSEYNDIMYMHVGGSPDALDKIQEYDVFDLNEFYRGWYYWRSTDRYAPHNVYTSSNLWEQAWDEYGPEDVEQSSSTSWQFEEWKSLCEGNCVYEFTLNFLPPTYAPTWKFNTSTGEYERYQMGYPHVDKDGSLITADTVIVQFVKTEVLDGVGRLGMDTIGEGEAMIFRDGSRIHAKWQKDSRTSRTQFVYVRDGHEIELNPGKIWIEVLNQRAELEMSVRD